MRSTATIAKPLPSRQRHRSFCFFFLALVRCRQALIRDAAYLDSQNDVQHVDRRVLAQMHVAPPSTTPNDPTPSRSIAPNSWPSAIATCPCPGQRPDRPCRPCRPCDSGANSGPDRACLCRPCPGQRPDRPCRPCRPCPGQRPVRPCRPCPGQRPVRPCPFTPGTGEGSRACSRAVEGHPWPNAPPANLAEAHPRA